MFSRRYKGAKTLAGDSKDLFMMTDGDLKSASPVPRMNCYGTEAAWLWESTTRFEGMRMPPLKSAFPADEYATQLPPPPGKYQDCETPGKRDVRTPATPTKGKSPFSGVVEPADELEAQEPRRSSIHLLL